MNWIRIAGFAAALTALAVLAWAPPADARRGSDAAHEHTIAAADLPREARQTLERISHGGPFAYSRDGVPFGNRESLLPRRSRSYYHEYTVPTPGSGDRGARRIVCGGEPASLDECYYSGDHYRSFRRIRP